MRFSIPAFFGRAEAAAEPAPAPAPQAAPVPDDTGTVLRRTNAETTSEFGVPVTYMSSGIPEVDSAFGYGHLDGHRGVPPENFRAYIGHTVEGEAIERLLADLETREREAREKADALRTQRAEIAARTRELEALRERRERAERELAEAEVAVREQTAVCSEHWHSGSRSQAAIFIVAALLFIIGDVVMSQKIVADALNMTGEMFLGIIDESWMFAFGLAMISIVLKPAFDRLVEKPYWHGKETRFVVTISALAILSVVTLWVLGAFRFEANSIRAAIDLVMNNPALSPAEKARQLAALSARMNGSHLARWSFILSGILFAAAGAASLSIGLRYWRYHHHVRKPGTRRLKAQLADREQTRTARGSAAQELANREAELERIIAQVADQPAASVYELRVEDLVSERRELLARLVTERRHRLSSLYDTGYELGTVKAREEAEKQQVQLAEQKPRRKRPRPFVALRRVIREQAIQPPTRLN
jgi:hypothetical protein